MAQQLLQQATAQRDLEQIAQLWVQQMAVDWAALRNGAAQRLPLPTYPFARERYWVHQHGTLSDETPAAAERDDDPDVFIAVFLGRLLGLTSAQWSSQAPLQRSGVDSLIGMRLLDALNARYGV